MTGKIYFILGSSFVMGMLAGAYLYVTVFATSFESDISTSEALDDGAVVIEGQMYGGCMETDSCGSFKLVDDRSYMYLEYPDADIVKGRLPSDISGPLFEIVGTNSFFTASGAVAPSNCDSYVDGVDYAYGVSFGVDEYTLDTCETALAYDLKLQRLLLDAWAFMENPTTTYPTIIEKGIGAYVEEILEENLAQ